MTGPTRKEVERVKCAECDCGIGGVYCTWIASAPQAYLAEITALRERLEAAEARVKFMEGCNAIDRDFASHAGNQLADATHRFMRAEAALTESRAREAAAWEAAASEVERYMIGAGAGSGPFHRLNQEIAAHLRTTPPTDATAALTAVKDAEWNAAIEAAADKAGDESETFPSNCACAWGRNRGDACIRHMAYNTARAIRAIRRNPKEGV